MWTLSSVMRLYWLWVKHSQLCGGIGRQSFHCGTEPMEITGKNQVIQLHSLNRLKNNGLNVNSKINKKKLNTKYVPNIFTLKNECQIFNTFTVSNCFVFLATSRRLCPSCFIGSQVKKKKIYSYYMIWRRCHLIEYFYIEAFFQKNSDCGDITLLAEDMK